MYPVYYVPAGDVLPVFFSSYGKTNGESITLTGLAVTDIEIYKDGSVTQRASDAGYTLLDTDGIDFDAITGIHGFSIDTGDNTDAGFYAVGAWYHVVVSAVTVDAQTVNFIACAFRIMAAEDGAGIPDVNVTHFGGTAGTFSGGRPEVNTTHAAGTAWGSGAITAAAIATGAIDADALAADAGTEIGTAVWATTTRQLTSAQTFDLTGSITGNLSGSVGSVTGAVGSVTGAVGSVTGAVGSVTGAVGSISGVTFPTNFGSIVITAGGIVDADIESINGVTIVGDGSATPFHV